MSQKLSKLSASPERNTFQRDSYLKRQAEKGLTPDNDQDTRAMLEMYESMDSDKQQRECNADWVNNNLEYDLRSTVWMVQKVRDSDSYAQNLYAALCNNDFQQQQVWPVLKDQTWSCSWRYAGGIVADMRQQGDYIDWYCSGIRQTDHDEDVNKQWDEKNYMGEGQVSDEVREDLLRLGWAVIPNNDY
jgi:hypothetical protein